MFLGRKIYRHQGRAHRIAIVPDSTSNFYSCGEDGVCCLYDLRDKMQRLFAANYMEDQLLRENISNNELPSLKITYRNRNNKTCSIYSVGVNPLNSNEIALSGTNAFISLYDVRKATVPYANLCPKHMLNKANSLHVTGLKYR